jgi:tetratricopeptide (TPR) repeat protein
MKKLLLLLLFTLPACLMAQTIIDQVRTMPVIGNTVDGHPGIKIPGWISGANNQPAGVAYTYIWRMGDDNDPALAFHLYHVEGFTTGQLTITRERVVWQPDGKNPEKHRFDLPFSEIRIKSDYTLNFRNVYVKAGKIRDHYMYEGMCDDGQCHENFSPQLTDFLYLALTDFPAAEAQFWRLRGDLLKPSEIASFQQQAAAWRALAVKPELSEEARKQRLLAESYFRNKDFKGSIEHYKLGVKADLTWPEGWYNLAALYAETGEYASAAISMKNYLELMPNSLDAPAARDKIVIWEDRAGKQ